MRKTYSDWINYKDLFKCRADNENAVNIFIIENLAPVTYTDYEEDLMKCINLFDENDYLIIVIFGRNGHYEAPHLPKFFIELISPLISIKYYKGVKIHEVSSEKIPVEYGPKNISYFAEPIDLSYEYNEKLIEKKKSLKHIGKPTNILIYTDGNLVSIAAVIMKNFQHYGWGIVAAYFEYPQKNNIPFDSSQSTSILIVQDRLLLRSPRGYGELFKRYNNIINMPKDHYFYGDFNFKYPLEYSVTPVDERVEIFEYLKDTNYQLFIDEEKKIFEKYKT